MNSFPYKRIVVIGTTSSGKSTLAKRLAEIIGGDFIELDALYWEPNWVGATPEVFRERAEAATSSRLALPKEHRDNVSEVERVWAVAGNYHVVRDLIWLKAEAVIWLDYPLPILFWRLLKRTVKRWITQEELWNGNREAFWWHFKIWSEESLFHWLFKSYWRRKREYPILLAQPEYSHLKIYRFMKPSETEEWLAKINLLSTQR